jgi:hypothetical protein
MKIFSKLLKTGDALTHKHELRESKNGTITQFVKRYKFSKKEDVLRF